MVDNDETIAANLFYIVMGSVNVNGETKYKAITTRFKEMLLSESDVRACLKLGILSAGCRLDKDGKIELASLENKLAEPTKVVNEEPKVISVEEKKEEPKVEEPVKPEVKELEVTKVTEPNRDFDKKPFFKK